MPNSSSTTTTGIATFGLSASTVRAARAAVPTMISTEVESMEPVIGAAFHASGRRVRGRTAEVGEEAAASERLEQQARRGLGRGLELGAGHGLVVVALARIHLDVGEQLVDRAPGHRVGSAGG